MKNMKKKFEKKMEYYFPQLSLNPGSLNDYKNNYVNMAWFFYEEGVTDAEKQLKKKNKDLEYTAPDRNINTGGWKVEMIPTLFDFKCNHE